MYIHSYQIQNVLNEYRKQLRQGPSPTTGRQQQVHNRSDVVIKGQRQSIIDQVSNNIVERIKNSDSVFTFSEALAEQLQTADQYQQMPAQDETADLTYTYINDQNQKLTNTFRVQNLNAAINQSGKPDSPPHSENNTGEEV